MNINPYNLPKSIDFHKATREFPLAREHKAKFQIALSKMTKEQVKKTIKDLQKMEYDCLSGKAQIEWNNIKKRIEKYGEGKEKEAYETITEPLSPELKDELKMACYCGFAIEFAKKYLYSLEKQKKI